MIRAVGELIGRHAQALALAAAIEKGFSELATPHPGPIIPSQPHPGPNTSSVHHQFPILPHSPRTAYLIWRKPWMAAGGGTFIDDMLQRCGLHNILSDQDRYPVIEPATLAASNCELVLLSSEPYPFREKHIREVQTLLPNASIRLVDGELFSWYGSRLLHAPAYFAATF